MEAPAIQTYPNPLQNEKQARSNRLFRMLSREHREPIFWILLTLFWTLMGLVGFLMILTFGTDVADAGRVVFIRVASGFVLTAGLRACYRRFLFRSRGALRTTLWVAGCCAIAVAIEIGILRALMDAGISIPGGAETVGIRLLVVRLFILAVWSALYFAFHLLESEEGLVLRAGRAELAARENELKHLQAQMNPHFLFNALDAVLANKDDPAAVEEVTRSIADYLRFSLRETAALEPLSREIDALEKYLGVQTRHFGGNLLCRIQCDKAAGAILVPPMLVQPLLENAFQHGSATDEAPIQVWLTATLDADFLRVTVSNTGCWVTPADNSPGSKGLRTLRQRLTLLLGPQAQVEQQSDNGWVRVTIRIPLPKPQP